MSEALSQTARILKLGPISRFIRKRAEIGLFHTLSLFRRTIGDRQEVRIDGKTVIYDIFPCKNNRYIAVIGYYGRLNGLENFTCTFESGAVEQAEWIDDYPHTWEGEQVLVGLFTVPEADKRAGRTSICLRSTGIILTDGVTMRFAERETRNLLSVVTMMKDEDPYLREWIEYYRLLGADHFYIYDNKSLRRNRIRKILKPYIQRQLVTLIDWDYPYAVDKSSTWRFCQRGQMHHCLYKYGHLSNWMLFIDVDEFVYPVDTGQMSLLPLLESYNHAPEVAALQFKMMWFGNSGCEKIPRGLLIEHYCSRSAEIVEHGREKCCVKPDRVKLLFIHGVKQCVDGSHQIAVTPEQYRLNHYYATSATRRRSIDNRFNDVEDKGMLRFVPELHQRLKGQIS